MRHRFRWSLPAFTLLALALLACRRAPVPVPLRPEVSLPLVPPMTGGRGAVLGIVADSALGFPIVGALVFVAADTGVGLGEPRPTPGLPVDSTDPRGGFALGEMPPGRHTLAVRHTGYFTHREIVVVLGGVADTLVVRLQRPRVTPP
jgi:hypothetical protein